MTTTSAQPSLRSLARHLGCSHAALSKKVHSGLLTAGVRLDARGRVVVTDFDAAAAEWSSIHVGGRWRAAAVELAGAVFAIPALDRA